MKLEHVAMQARPYPDHLLEGCETGVALFAAAFRGHNDAIHYALAGMRGTCVDVDVLKLHEMQALYPVEWSFRVSDAWEFAEHHAKRGIMYDAVSCDTWTGDLMRRALDSLELWCSIARKLVTVTIDDTVEEIDVPEGWTSSLYPRSDHVSWLVLERR